MVHQRDVASLKQLIFCPGLCTGSGLEYQPKNGPKTRLLEDGARCTAFASLNSMFFYLVTVLNFETNVILAPQYGNMTCSFEEEDKVQRQPFLFDVDPCVCACS